MGHVVHTQDPNVLVDAVLAGQVQGMMAGGDAHVPHEHPQFCACMQAEPPALVARQQEGHEGQQTEVHW